MLVALLPVIAQLGMWLVERVILKSGERQELRELHVRLSRAFRDAGIESVRSRFESDAQIAAAGDEWDRRETGGEP